MKINIMKRLFLLCALCMFSLLLQAQGCKLCGKWEGSYSLEVPDPYSDGLVAEQFMMLMKIDSHENNYLVRVKSYPVKDKDNVRYWNNCEIISSSANQVYFKAYASTSYDWDGVTHKGKRVYSADNTWYATATYEGGKIRFVYHLHVVYKDKSGEPIDYHDNPKQTIMMYDSW